MRRFNKYVFVFLLVALLLRVILLIWSVTYPLDANGDQTRYENWAHAAHIYSFAKSYDPAYVEGIANHMPPGTIYVASGAYESYILTGKVINKLTHTAPGSIHWVNTYLQHIMMRIPNVLADIFIGLLLYLLVRKQSTVKRGLLAGSLIWFNPLVIYNSTIWGQMDAITNFFFMLALFLAFSKQYILAILSFACSIFIKLSLLPMLPFFLVFLFFHSGKQWKKLLVGIFLACAGIVLATTPISSEPLLWLKEHWGIFSKGELQNISLAAFNFWWAITCFHQHCPLSTQLFLSISLSTWGYLLFAALTIPVFFWQITKAKQFSKEYYAFFVFAFVAISVFLVMPRMHDRYLYPFFPLFAAVVTLSKHPKQFLMLFIALSVIHFANLLSSWYPTRYPNMMLHDISYGDLYRWILSVLLVCISVVFYIVSFRALRENKPHS